MTTQQLDHLNKLAGKIYELEVKLNSEHKFGQHVANTKIEIRSFLYNDDFATELKNFCMKKEKQKIKEMQEELNKLKKEFENTKIVTEK